MEPMGTGSLRLSNKRPAKSFGGKKSVKGNRQGSLSRSITPPQRAKLQNNLTYLYFAILKAACPKSPTDFLDKLREAMGIGSLS